MKTRLYYNTSWLHEAGHTLDEQAKIYEDTLKDVADNPRFYLDRLEELAEYRVSWKNYSRKCTPTLPLKYVNRKVYK